MVLRYHYSFYLFIYLCTYARSWHYAQFLCNTFTEKSPNFMFEGYKTFAGNLKKRLSCCYVSIQLLLCFLTSALHSYYESRYCRSSQYYAAIHIVIFHTEVPHFCLAKATTVLCTLRPLRIYLCLNFEYILQNVSQCKCQHVWYRVTVHMPCWA